MVERAESQKNQLLRAWHGFALALEESWLMRKLTALLKPPPASADVDVGTASAAATSSD